MNFPLLKPSIIISDTNSDDREIADRLAFKVLLEAQVLLAQLAQLDLKESKDHVVNQ